MINWVIMDKVGQNNYDKDDLPFEIPSDNKTRNEWCKRFSRFVQKLNDTKDEKGV